MPEFSEGSKQKLVTCDKRLQDVLNEVIKNINFTVLEGHRGQEEQEDAFARGASKLHYPFGKHNQIPSRAVDIAPWYIDTKEHIDWKDVVAFGRLMGYIQHVAEVMGIRLRFGLDWDGDWHTAGMDSDETFRDAPHVELVDP
jgi:peptidoglycan L-alanyl-D-glutamate endopeptidase CwlK